MPDADVLHNVTTTDGAFLVLAIVLPAIGVLLSFVLGGRYAERIAFVLLPSGFVLATIIFVDVWRSGHRLVYIVGDWKPPLGIALRADGLSAAMMVAMTIVFCAVAIFAYADFGTRAGSTESRAPFAFWILLMAIWGAMNLVFLGGDLFTLYVALELLTFAAVPLVCLDGRAETLQAALRYLIFALLGSILYLVGTALLYGSYATLDIALLSRRVHAEPATLVAATLMTIGLFAKTALFPLHLWLPPAHAGAPAAASAVLSAVVVKGSFFLVVRLWFDVMPGMLGGAGAQLFGALGAAAIIFGSVVALQQQRLKLLIAYSTVAQIGYLFLIFPLALDASAQFQGGGALTGGIIQAISHATAKAAMFMAAGLIYAALGHDRIAELGGSARALPMTIFAFALGGVSLIGLPPSGGFLAKWLLLEATVATGQWWWALVILAGGLFTSCYMFIVLSRAVAPPSAPLKLRVAVPKYQEAAALALALISLLLGLVTLGPIDIVEVGRLDPIMAGSR
jgi:formate hydrogenlyase subunit 3/multisubunit Na+/H+ antiporter MnhD subunit